MWRLLAILTLNLFLMACDKTQKNQPAVPNTPTDNHPSSCLTSERALMKPPSNRLPCELMPPKG